MGYKKLHKQIYDKYDGDFDRIYSEGSQPDECHDQLQ